MLWKTSLKCMLPYKVWPFNWSVSRSTCEAHWQDQGRHDHQGNPPSHIIPCRLHPISSIRIPPPIGKGTVRLSPYSVYMASPSLTPNNSRSGSSSRKKLPRETTGSWGRSMTCTSSMNWVLAAVSSFLVELTFTTRWWNLSGGSTGREDTKRWSHQIYTTTNSGSLLGTGLTILWVVSVCLVTLYHHYSLFMMWKGKPVSIWSRKGEVCTEAYELPWSLVRCLYSNDIMMMSSLL